MGTWLPVHTVAAEHCTGFVFKQSVLTRCLKQSFTIVCVGAREVEAGLFAGDHNAQLVSGFLLDS